VSARAALDAARAVFQPSLGRLPAQATTAPTWVDVDEALATVSGRADAMWRAAEQVLQAAVGHPELSGQALVGEARRQNCLTLGDAHALVALQGWADRARDVAVTIAPAATGPDEDERRIAREAWLALEHAADRPMPPAETWASAASPARPATSPSVSPPSMSPPSMSSPSMSPPSMSPPPRGDPAPEWAAPPVERRRAWYSSPAFVVGIIALVLFASAGGWYLYDRQRDRDFEDGLAAYERGAREVARMSFARAAQDHPDDARPLIFLGRLSREENDIARARRFLESAVALDPASAVAQRELASALLADGQPELARRFYVRAIELDPTDRLAQGFLGCALYRLGRYDEARRWANRAGPGDWMPCLSAPIPTLPPMNPPMLATPPR